MVAKSIRTTIGIGLVALGVIFTIIPGSILFVLAGLVLLAVDHHFARSWLKKTQKVARKGAVKLDSWLLNRR